jgi:cathepsin F
MKLISLLTLAGSVQALGNITEMFEQFKEKFDKKYESDAEELVRFKKFVSNMELLEKLKEVDENAQYSHLTPFADRSEEEMNTMKGFRPSMAKKTDKKAPILDTSDLPDSFDWREKGAVNKVKDQAQCGSCWAFATVANVEGQNFVETGELVSLSEQELVDCSESDNGCGGGLPQSAYEDLINDDRGLELESAYSYDAQDGTCQASKSKEKVFLSGWTPVSKDEDQIRAAVMKYGPLAIGINATWMQLYFGGISDPPTCNPAQLDHGVAIVGWGEEAGKPYWVIRNSWGPSWGEDGYYRIIRNKGKCGLNTMVTSAEVSKSSIFV